MQICSWNVNGLRSLYKNGYDHFLMEKDIDIFCLQEVKMQTDLFTDDMFAPNKSFWNTAQRTGYSGVTTIANQKLATLSIHEGIGEPSLDDEGRVLTIELEAFILVNTYAPHSHRELKRLAEKERFIVYFNRYIQSLRGKQKPIIIVGDLNVAHKEIDLYHYKKNKKNAGFLPQERQWITDLEKLGFIDAFRYLYPNRKEYSWWGLMHNLRERNIGWRIDYVLVDNSLKDKIKDCFYLKDQLGSDHCPVILEIDI